MKFYAKFKTNKRKNIFSIGFILILTITGACKTEMNILETDTKNNTDMLKGLCNRQAFENAGFKVWFDESYFGYNPEESVIDEISGILQNRNINITIVFGSWCSDSKREVPRFYKIMDNVGFPVERIKLIAVDRKKQAGRNLTKGLAIELVPTFIFFENAKEIGRIIETPKVSLESDMLEIIR
jgi:thiol-disulfide isomerase/thioredoxin